AVSITVQKETDEHKQHKSEFCKKKNRGKGKGKGKQKDSATADGVDSTSDMPASSSATSGASKKPKKKWPVKPKYLDDIYVHDLDQEYLNATKGQMVFIDPGRHDRLFCGHEDTSPDKPMLYHYTLPCENKEQCKQQHQWIIYKAKKNWSSGDFIFTLEETLVLCPTKTVLPTNVDVTIRV
ncbi:hypothetical protein LPJ64_001157, partial [Coemansia asiatica]